MMSTLKIELEQAIEELSLSQHSVCIHASLRSFQNRDDTLPKEIATAFLKQHCTIVVPTFSDEYETAPSEKYMPLQNGAGDYSYWVGMDSSEIPVFTTDSTSISVDEMGKFPHYILRMLNHVRGNHPLNSFTAIGTNANHCVENQSIEDVYAPLKYLYDTEGYLLLMGVDLTSATAIHLAEELAGRKPFVRWAKDCDQQIIGVHCGGCSDGFCRFDQVVKQIEQQVVVHGSLWHCYPMKEFVDCCIEAIQKNPQITHCDNSMCERCNDAVLGGPYYK